MKIRNRITAILLCALLLLGCMPLCVGAAEGKAELYEGLYGDDMLFQQGEPMLLGGMVRGGGLHVTGVLLDASGKAVAKGETIANKSNRFTLSMPAPKGGYDLYTVVLWIEGVEFARLERVVFGELWMASGQSNMAYPLFESAKGKQMFTAGETCNPDIHVLNVPSFVEYEGDTERFPDEEQRGVPGATWYKGDSYSVWSLSAVAYFFADSLQKQLDMPVGMINCALGGTSIYTWLSRGAIEGDTPVKDDLTALGRYVSSDDWKQTGHDVSLDMTVNYNKKVAALGVFRPQGLLWYQGETEIFHDVPTDAYARAFDLLQRSWSYLFVRREDDALLPILYSGLAPYNYGGDRLAKYNAAFGRMQQLRPDVRAFIPNYDLPLDFTLEIGSIHPATKAPIGERMAHCALQMLYGRRGSTRSAAVPVSVRCEDGGVNVTFAYTGTGLAFDGDVPYGFSVCGADGVYVQADAEIVSPDTIRISAPEVPEPAGAAYACTGAADKANLYAVEGDGFRMPVSPFVTDPDPIRQLWQGRGFLTFDFPQIWRYAAEAQTGFSAPWSAKNAEIEYTSDAVRGSAVKLTANKKTFSLRSVGTYKDGAKKPRYRELDMDYRLCRAMTVQVRNDGNMPVTLTEMRLHVNNGWYAPAANDRQGKDNVIPADGQWHTVTFDLDTLYRRGVVCGATYSRAKLDKVIEIELRFAGDDSAQVSVDELRCTPDGSNGARVRFIPRFGLAKYPWDYVFCAVMWMLSPFTKK